jgi:hypothetical protein
VVEARERRVEMSRSVVAIAGGVLLLGVTAARPARCMTERDVVKAHVPFAFEVEGTHLPAGDYELRLEGTYAPGVVELRELGPDSRAMLVITNAENSGPIRHAELVFDGIATQKFLRAVRLPGEGGVELPVVSAEVQAARNVASQSQPATKR